MARTRAVPAGLDLAVVLGATAVLYAAVIPSMVQDWYLDENYSHGFLVPLVSLYLLWDRRREVAEAARRARGSWAGLVLCLVSLALFVLGRAGAELFLQRSSLVFLLMGAVLWLWGWRVFAKVLFPLAFLLFMVPLPYLVYDSVAFPLKLLAARVATDSLFWLGVPVFREGNIIHLASQTLEVADACSGIRSLVSLLALGVVYAYFMSRGWWRRLLLVVATVPIAIAANALRITGTGLLTHYVSPEAAEGFFHTFSGWVVFVAAFVMLFVVGWVLNRIGPRRSRP
ncbi:MAG: exosortase [Deltaproteobacteria bacterium]|nr:exosortase [Deltaproteobacteria bacterium]